MTDPSSAGARFRAALAAETPLQVMGAITAYAGLMAKRTGYKALYLSGGGVAANSLGMPDLGISTMEDVLTDARRIVDATGMPLLVDIDTEVQFAQMVVFNDVQLRLLQNLRRGDLFVFQVAHLFFQGGQRRKVVADAKRHIAWHQGCHLHRIQHGTDCLAHGRQGVHARIDQQQGDRNAGEHHHLDAGGGALFEKWRRTVFHDFQ